MTWQTFGVFLATTFFISMTPGPNMLLAMGLGLRFGVRRAIWGGVGMCLALAIMAALSAAGLGALLATSTTAFDVVKWAGVAYLAWLGVASWRAPVEAVRSEERQIAPEGERSRLAIRGALVAASNPKALVFMAALFPQFIDPQAPLLPQLGILITILVIVEFGWILAYAAGGGSLGARLTSVGATRLLNRVTGGLLIAAGLLLALVRQA